MSVWVLSSTNFLQWGQVMDLRVGPCDKGWENVCAAYARTGIQGHSLDLVTVYSQPMFRSQVGAWEMVREMGLLPRPPVVYVSFENAETQTHIGPASRPY